MVEAGLPAVYVLQAATRINSELVRMNDVIGTITEGKFADIVAVDKNPPFL